MSTPCPRARGRRRLARASRARPVPAVVSAPASPSTCVARWRSCEMRSRSGTGPAASASRRRVPPRRLPEPDTAAGLRRGAAWSSSQLAAGRHRGPGGRRRAGSPIVRSPPTFWIEAAFWLPISKAVIDLQRPAKSLPNRLRTNPATTSPPARTASPGTPGRRAGGPVRVAVVGQRRSAEQARGRRGRARAPRLRRRGRSRRCAPARRPPERFPPTLAIAAPDGSGPRMRCRERSVPFRSCLQDGRALPFPPLTPVRGGLRSPAYHGHRVIRRVLRLFGRRLQLAREVEAAQDLRP